MVIDDFLLLKYNSELNLEVIQNLERFHFVSREFEILDDDIDINKFNSFGYFFVNLLNKKNDIIAFLDKLSSKIESSSLIYENWNFISIELLGSESNIDNDFIPFYLHIIGEIIKKYKSNEESFGKDLDKINNEEAYLKKILTSEEELKEEWKKISNFNRYPSLDSYREYINNYSVLGFDIKKNFTKILFEKYSPNQCKKDLLAKIKKDQNKILECIDRLNFYLDKKQINYYSWEMVVPKCRKQLCFKGKKSYYRYSSINRGKKKNSKDDIKNIGEPIVLNVYEINSINELLDLYVGFFVDKKIDIRKCCNCGKYFISEYGTKYCNNLFRDTNKTCIEIGPKFKYSNKEMAKKYNTLVNRYRSKILHSNNPKKREFEKELERFKEEYSKLKKSKTKESDIEKWLDKEISEYDKKYISKNKLD